MSGWDCHTHVLGPFARFPLAAERSYTPPEATVESHLAHLDRIGLQHGVLVQPSAYGFDHTCLLDAIARSHGRLRGTGVLDRNVSDAELQRLKQGGVRALRFVETGAPGGQRFTGAVGVEEIPHLAPRMKALGMHAEFWLTCDAFVSSSERILKTNLTIVLDHMGRFDVAKGVEDKAFQELLALVREGRVWVKMTPQRNSKRFPEYEDVRPFHEALVKANPDVLVWGSDWPYLRMNETTPDAWQLINLLGEWSGDGAKGRILSANPSRLYGDWSL